MQSNALAALVRSTLLSGLSGLGSAYVDVQVRQVFQPSTVGNRSAPQITIQFIGARRIGSLGRRYTPASPDPDEPMTGTMLQWWETTLQVSALARRNPEDPAFLTLPSALDICKSASDILQSDAGLTALAAQTVRPLRITDIRVVQWVNESDQYESMPNFDLVLVSPETLTTSTPPVATFEPVTGRV